MKTGQHTGRDRRRGSLRQKIGRGERGGLYAGSCRDEGSPEALKDRGKNETWLIVNRGRLKTIR